ncbi:HD domain-containing phosphohydrolase [Stieleria varia]|uniref:Hydrogenase transcriptional regulatory protein hupR1 n=1 Tax=Stieleria varia TaxID=2528005 RepID=A0A5C6B4L9_9BACT|nr:HD domain-containing phosphohydrolase [Stieleria varia]TWU06421.1 Hydrogenase transcriptional regulatory protein hupR1 [Stieleria varia]
MPNTRVLFVDDDEMMLKGIVRQQGEDFNITTATGPHEALEILADHDPFAVVVSDMRMPEMNGVQLLKRVRDSHPDTVRMILTGFAELNTTIAAVNEGNIFRFLAKPCDEDVMAKALRDGLRQYELIEAERELVEGTLHGSVKVLADVLALVSPLAFGQSTRVRATVDGILKRVPVENQWQLDIAAMLSSLGCVSLPAELLNKKLNGQPLTVEEHSQFNKHPELASELLQNIPRMDEVSAIIENQASSRPTALSDSLKQKSMILKLALDYDCCELASESPLHALAKLQQSRLEYAPELFDALADFVKHERNFEILEVDVRQVTAGMVIAQDLFNSSGILMMSKGQTITSSALRLLENFARNKTLTGKIKIVSSNVTCPAI